MDNAFQILAVLIVIFVPLERCLTLNVRQKILRDGWTSDLIHYFVNTFVLQVGIVFLIISVYLPLRDLIPVAIRLEIFQLPAFVQLLLIMLIAEMGYYSAHRLMHVVPFLWRFHRVHHSSHQLDWLATARFHPLDLMITWSITTLPIILLGFSAKVFAVFQMIWLFQNYLAHSNIKWKIPIISRVLLTPQVHHWHHSADPNIYNTNFAGQLMFMDHLFGTYYHSKNETPQQYGPNKTEAASYIKDLIQPFSSNNK